MAATIAHADESPGRIGVASRPRLLSTPVFKPGSAEFNPIQNTVTMSFAIERRSEKRLEIRTPARILLGRGEILCHTQNISPGGLLLECPAQVVADRTMQVTVLVPAELLNDEEKWVQCKIEIKRINLLKNSKGFAIAGRILDVQLWEADTD
jgi:hypothetical protein